MMNKKSAIFRLVVLTILLINIVGFALVSFRVYFSLNQYAYIQTEEISVRVNQMVHGIIDSYNQDLAHLESNCREFLPLAKQSALASPYTRSISLTEKQEIFCSTITDEKRIFFSRPSAENLINLHYIPQSPIVKNSDVFLLILNRGNVHVNFGIDTFIFKNILNTDMNYFSPAFFIDGYYISEKRTEEMNTPHLQQYVRVGNPYIDLYYHLDTENYVNYALINYSFMYLMVTVFSFICGFGLNVHLSRIDWQVFAISKALKKRQFVPYLQPVFDRNRKLVGAEVLVRWIHPKVGIISPDDFIPSAEISGQINDIFTQLVEQLVKAFIPYQKHFTDDFHLALNVSAPQLAHPNLIRDCKHILYRLNKHNFHLIVELTERVHIPQDDLYLQGIVNIKNQGIKIALDDFGTGHSSLSYLKKIKIDFIKIDKSFVDMIGEEEFRDHIVANVLDLADRIGVPAVAEGVETEYQQSYLLRHNVAYFQGYFYDRPVSLDMFIERYLRISK